MNVLDLFSGIGGFSLGLERAGMKTIAFCEIEEFPRKVIKKHWPDVPIFKDVRELHATDIKETVDVVCGGYPCQGQSSAGHRRFKEDCRWLWPQMFRIIRECEPTWVIGENVAGHIKLGLDEVCFDLESEGYTARPFVIPACAVEADHRRDRVWVVAYRKSDRPQGWNFTGGGAKGNKQGVRSKPTGVYSRNGGWWHDKPRVVRGLHGVSNRVDRIKGLGNAVVPDIPEIIGRVIMEIEARHQPQPNEWGN